MTSPTPLTAAPDLVEPAPGFSGSIGVARRDITPPPGIFIRVWGPATEDVSTGTHRPLTLHSARARRGRRGPARPARGRSGLVAGPGRRVARPRCRPGTPRARFRSRAPQPLSHTRRAVDLPRRRRTAWRPPRPAVPRCPPRGRSRRGGGGARPPCRGLADMDDGTVACRRESRPPGRRAARRRVQPRRPRRRHVARRSSRRRGWNVDRDARQLRLSPDNAGMAEHARLAGLRRSAPRGGRGRDGRGAVPVPAGSLGRPRAARAVRRRHGRRRPPRRRTRTCRAWRPAEMPAPGAELACLGIVESGAPLAIWGPRAVALPRSTRAAHLEVPVELKVDLPTIEELEARLGRHRPAQPGRADPPRPEAACPVQRRGPMRPIRSGSGASVTAPSLPSRASSIPASSGGFARASPSEPSSS